MHARVTTVPVETARLDELVAVYQTPMERPRDLAGKRVVADIVTTASTLFERLVHADRASGVA